MLICIVNHGAQLSYGTTAKWDRGRKGVCQFSSRLVMQFHEPENTLMSCFSLSAQSVLYPVESVRASAAHRGERATKQCQEIESLKKLHGAPRRGNSATQAAQWLRFAIVDTCHLFPRHRLPYCCCATHKGDKDSVSRLHSMPACLFQFLPFCHFRKERKRVQN